MPNIPRVEAAYAAGWIDAEGCLTTSRRISGHYPLVQFNTIDLPLIIWFRERFGGMTWESRTPKGRKNFYWALSGEQVDGFLKQVYPFLVLKKPQAALLFKLRKINQQMRKAHVREQRLPKTEKVAAKIRALNQSDAGPIGKPRSDWREQECHAYAAGVIDGDGYVSRDGCSLSQKRRTLTELFLNLFGGSHSGPHKNGISRPLWTWRIGKKSNFLKQCSPYFQLIVFRDDVPVRSLR